MKLRSVAQAIANSALDLVKRTVRAAKDLASTLNVDNQRTTISLKLTNLSTLKVRKKLQQVALADPNDMVRFGGVASKKGRYSISIFDVGDRSKTYLDGRRKD